MIRVQKTTQNKVFKTKAVTKLDSGAKTKVPVLASNRVQKPDRRQRDTEVSDSKPTVPYPEKANPVWFTIILFVLLFQAPHIAAQTYTLTDGNSTVSIDPGSPAGVNAWTVDGQNQLNTEWLWYRVGNSGTAASVDTISTPTVSQPAAGALTTTYHNSQFSLQVVYSLVGGASGSGTSDLGEQVKIQNLTSAPLAFNFFQYSAFALGGVNNQSVQLGKNLQGKFNQALVSSGNVSITENIDGAFSPGANHGEAALLNSTINNLQNTAGYNLNDNMQAGPGNPTWALQWTNPIAPGSTLTISEDLNIAGVVITPVPEPSPWSVMSIGLIAFSTMKRYLGRRW